MGKHQPALLGGVFIGVLGSLPVVSSCCCLWMVAGGVLVVYLQQQASPTPVATGDAVIGGLIAGAIGALISCIAHALILRGTAPAMLEEFRNRSAEMPPEFLQMVERIFSGSGLGLFFALLILWLPMSAVFTMLGSFLGLAIFRKKTPPQPQV